MCLLLLSVLTTRLGSETHPAPRYCTLQWMHPLPKGSIYKPHHYRIKGVCGVALIVKIKDHMPPNKTSLWRQKSYERSASIYSSRAWLQNWHTHLERNLHLDPPVWRAVHQCHILYCIGNRVDVQHPWLHKRQPQVSKVLRDQQWQRTLLGEGFLRRRHYTEHEGGGNDLPSERSVHPFMGGSIHMSDRQQASNPSPSNSSPTKI